MIYDGPELSIIIPVLNEAETIEAGLQRLQFLRNHGVEILVVDGGSEDDSVKLAHALADQVIETDGHKLANRARQMNLGAVHATGRIFLFLHIDTQLPERAYQQIIKRLELPHVWGRFDVRLSGQNNIFRLIELGMNLRSGLTGVATGDQAIFISRAAFEQLQGYADLPLMEDVEMSKRLRKISFPICLKDKVITSSRRWQQNGIFKTIILMWWLRFLYFLGAHPRVLVEQYYRH